MIKSCRDTKRHWCSRVMRNAAYPRTEQAMERKSFRFNSVVKPIAPIVVGNRRIIFASEACLKEKDMSSRVVMVYD